MPRSKSRSRSKSPKRSPENIKTELLKYLKKGKLVNDKRVVTIKALKRKFSKQLTDFNFRNKFWGVANELADYYVNPEGMSDYLVYPKSR